MRKRSLQLRSAQEFQVLQPPLRRNRNQNRNHLPLRARRLRRKREVIIQKLRCGTFHRVTMPYGQGFRSIREPVPHSTQRLCITLSAHPGILFLHIRRPRYGPESYWRGLNSWRIQRNVRTRPAAARLPETQSIAALTARELPTKLKLSANAAIRNAGVMHKDK